MAMLRKLSSYQIGFLRATVDAIAASVETLDDDNGTKGGFTFNEVREFRKIIEKVRIKLDNQCDESRQATVAKQQVIRRRRGAVS